MILIVTVTQSVLYFINRNMHVKDDFTVLFLFEIKSLFVGKLIILLYLIIERVGSINLTSTISQCERANLRYLQLVRDP